MAETTTRNVKVLKFTPKKNFDDVEQAVNEACLDLAKQGHKVVSIAPLTVDTMPPTVLYNIIYE